MLSGMLFLALFGLGWLDVALCHGADGHVGFKTNGASCCLTTTSATSDPRDVTSLHAGSAAPPGHCEDTPLLQGLRTPQAGSGPASVAGPSPVAFAYAAFAVAAGAASTPGPHPILIRLRSTTLLI